MAERAPEELMSIHLGDGLVHKMLFFYSEQLFVRDQFEKWIPTCPQYLFESK